MRSVKCHRSTLFSCKAVGHGPERIEIDALAAEIDGLLRRDQPFPAFAVLRDAFARGRAQGKDAQLPTGGVLHRALRWKPFELTAAEYEELRAAWRASEASGLDR